jgi:hypothetical protein
LFFNQSGDTNETVDGHIYDHFCDEDLGVSCVPEAKSIEGKLGFLLTNEEYTPVEFNSGEWVPAKKEAVQKVYEEQMYVWICNGTNMPNGYHKTFLSMLDKAI